MTDIPVHPLANIFPMFGDDELAELAADIKANGLQIPIVLDAAGDVLVDGRNRLAACKLAGVEPRFERLDGQHPAAFIVSANLHRRNLTKGQQAMALAMIYPEPEKGGRGHKSERVAETSTVSAKRLQLARAVLRYSPELARNVLAGGLSLDQALRDVETAQGSDANRRARIARLRADRPDLADAVVDEAMTLDEAEAKAKADEAARKQRRWAVTVNLVEAIDLLDPQPADAVAMTLSNFDPAIAEQKGGRAITAERLHSAAQYLFELSSAWGRK